MSAKKRLKVKNETVIFFSSAPQTIDLAGDLLDAGRGL